MVFILLNDYTDKKVYKSQFTEGIVMRKKPDPNVIHPIAGYDKEIYVKPTITNPNIIVGDFTYILLEILLILQITC